LRRRPRRRPLAAASQPALSAQAQQPFAPSIDIGPTGTLKLHKGLAAYEFNRHGMTRNAVTSPLAAGAAALAQSFRIAEADVEPARELGRGASGVVHKAFWPAAAEWVAVKRVSVLERGQRHQLMNDVKALCAAPDAPGLVRFRGAFHCADRGQVAIALEYMDGGSLADALARVGKIPEPVLATITARVLAGLAHLHARHTVHRDLKPANILLSTAGEAKLSDFGVSAFVDGTLAQCHTFLGTVTYMSPERVDGAAYAFPADVWALGLVLVECVTGKYPYDASKGAMELMVALMEDAAPVPPEGAASPALRDLIARCLRKDPAARPTAEELLRLPWVAGAPPRRELRAFMRRVAYNAEEKADDAARVAAARLANALRHQWHDANALAEFYAADAALDVAGAAGGAAPSGRAGGGGADAAPAPLRLKGRYTIVEHFQALMRGLAAGGADVAVELSGQARVARAAPPPAAPGERAAKALVVVTQRVTLRDEARRPGGSGFTLRGGVSGGAGAANAPAETLGVYDEELTLRLFSLESPAPGAGFAVAAHAVRWVVAPKVARPVRESGLAAPKCRQQ
jgi:hypothetical protein